MAPDARAEGLRRVLRERIREGGPITLAEFMATALLHPRFGYYTGDDPFGTAGDFVTAPEISQMFGELLGAWSAAVWEQAGRPDPALWVELGPGRGTLMADALVATRRAAAFRGAVRLHLIEASPARRDAQRALLAARAPGVPVTWHADAARLPAGPAILLANELFDALPVHQFERRAGTWRERRVAWSEAEGFGLAPGPPSAAIAHIPAALADAPEGAVVEVSPAAHALADLLARRIAAEGGAALIVDFGRAAHSASATLQAVRRHRRADVLADVGSADLAAHVDFAALNAAATAAGARAWGPVAQGEFLERLGIAARAGALAAAAPDRAAEIAAARARLTGADGMGRLFLALAITRADAPPPPGFG